ncbi:hypothetical protein [Simkania negevensis]|uniref:Uncharacterized protein n=1 Tax=Simkania negevensis (strain ATCC VR-1471 / DSM 27360 / Z) TaxID=331113 RepID=F8L2U4_SIMNZ|nr:hypothetical protein [Simkania negevensis]CCB87790.1 unknown protein [Simkania negevensis Z]
MGISVFAKPVRKGREALYIYDKASKRRIRRPTKSICCEKGFTTYERFGYSKLRQPFKESGFAEPKFIVAEDLKDFFEREKIRGVEFEPMTMP